MCVFIIVIVFLLLVVLVGQVKFDVSLFFKLKVGVICEEVMNGGCFIVIEMMIINGVKYFNSVWIDCKVENCDGFIWFVNGKVLNFDLNEM